MRFRVLVLAGFTISFALWAGKTSLTIAAPQASPPPNVGDFSSVNIHQHMGAPVLDLHLDGKGRAVRFYTPEQKNPRAYFNESGQFYTNGWITISGTMKGEGEGYNIEPPTLDPSMLYVWSDVIGPAIEVRTANTDDRGSYLFQGLDRTANYVFSIEQDGALRWGAASRAAMDTRLYRSAAKTLKTDGALVVSDKVGIGTSDPVSTLHIGGSQSVQQTGVTTDYAVSDRDYYIGVTNTAARPTITLPKAGGRAGRVYIIKDESGEAQAHPITVKAPPGETIDGAVARTITANYGVLRVICSGKN